jgi:hypothetical protein
MQIIKSHMVLQLWTFNSNMEQQEWIDGAFEETDTDYTIAGMNILYKEETEYLKKGVKLLCDKLHPNSVLEFGFGKGWTATEFQEQGIKRHVILEPNKEVYQTALDWKDKYSSDIEIVNAFSWEFETDEKFDLVYDDRLEVISEENHDNQMKKILPLKQWYSGNAIQSDNRKISDYPIFFELDGANYVQSLVKYGEYKKWLP